MHFHIADKVFWQSQGPNCKAHTSFVYHLGIVAEQLHLLLFIDLKAAIGLCYVAVEMEIVACSRDGIDKRVEINVDNTVSCKELSIFSKILFVLVVGLSANLHL